MAVTLLVSLVLSGSAVRVDEQVALRRGTSGTANPGNPVARHSLPAMQSRRWPATGKADPADEGGIDASGTGRFLRFVAGTA